MVIFIYLWVGFFVCLFFGFGCGVFLDSEIVRFFLRDFSAGSSREWHVKMEVYLCRYLTNSNKKKKIQRKNHPDIMQEFQEEKKYKPVFF